MGNLDEEMAKEIVRRKLTELKTGPRRSEDDKGCMDKFAILIALSLISLMSFVAGILYVVGG